MNMKRVQDVVEKYGLVELPGEGGFYKETGRDDRKALYDGFEGERNLSTSIYFLMTPIKFSAWHKIKNREEWSFHEGRDIRLHRLDNEGNYSCEVLGTSEHAVHKTTVEPGTWFAAEVISQNSAPEDSNFSLVTCVCVPGFEFSDLTIANRDELLTLCSSSEGKNAIMQLTRIEKKEQNQSITYRGNPVHRGNNSPRAMDAASAAQQNYGTDANAGASPRQTL